MTVASRTTALVAGEGTEVSARTGRRRFTVAYKTRIVEEAAQCRAPGEIGSLLRREGLYSSHLTTWRKLYHAGARQALTRSRGPKPRAAADGGELARLQRENAQLREQLARAELVIGIQKKLSELLVSPPTSTSGANT